jgi:hypothetical protein
MKGGTNLRCALAAPALHGNQYWHHLTDFLLLIAVQVTVRRSHGCTWVLVLRRSITTMFFDNSTYEERDMPNPMGNIPFNFDLASVRSTHDAPVPFEDVLLSITSLVLLPRV